MAVALLGIYTYNSYSWMSWIWARNPHIILGSCTVYRIFLFLSQARALSPLPSLSLAFLRSLFLSSVCLKYIFDQHWLGSRKYWVLARARFPWTLCDFSFRWSKIFSICYVCTLFLLLLLFLCRINEIFHPNSNKNAMLRSYMLYTKS